jgi:hypothetical protein
MSKDHEVTMVQRAPWPHALEKVLGQTTYKQDVIFQLHTCNRDDGCEGLTLDIICNATDSYAPEHVRRTRHRFIVPAATYDERAWTRWVFDRVIEIEVHEACEFFKVNNVRPYAPTHGAGRNPYVVVEHAGEGESAVPPGGRNIVPELRKKIAELEIEVDHWRTKVPQPKDKGMT